VIAPHDPTDGLPLLEREEETRALRSVVDRLMSGEGSMVLIEGPAGIGKTSLLREAEAIGRAEGVRVRVARAGRLERRMPYGIARQLLEPVIERASAKERSQFLDGAASLSLVAFGQADDRPQEVDSFAPIHGLYWLLANLCETEAFLLLIDDIQWADSESIRWLDFLARRAADIQAGVVATVRTGDPQEPPELEGLRADARSSLRPGALSARAQETFIRARLEHVPVDEVLAACDRTSGGNPFLLEELVRTLREQGIEPDAPTAAAAIEGIGPDSVAQSLHARVQSCGAEATSIAEAVAVLGETVQLRQVAALSATEEHEAGRLCDRLRAAEVLAPGKTIEFAHPLVRSAVYQSLQEHRRSELHKRAAEVLAHAGADSPTVAPHLLACLPNGDQWVVGQLERAAREALDSGAPEAARRYLERAIDEPSRDSIRLRYELARALWRTNPSDALSIGGAVADESEDAELRLQAVETVAWAYFDCGDLKATAEWLRRLVETLPSERVDEMLQAEANLSCISLMHDGRSASTSERIEAVVRESGATDRGELLARQALAIDRFLAGHAVDDVIALAKRFPPPPWTGRGPVPGIACNVLAWCGEWALARDATADGWESARSSGVLHVASYRESFLAEIDRLAGRLTDSEAEARTAWEIVRDFSPVSLPALLAITNLITTLVARGLVDEASRLAEGWDLSAPFSVVPVTPVLLETRGVLRLARGELSAGTDDLMAVGEDLEAFGITNPAFSSWRQEAVPALVTVERSAEAVAVASEGEARARRFGAPHVIGTMLRARAATEGKRQAIETLQDSVAELRRQGPPHELARSLLDLGAALRRSGLRRESREPLLESLELAERSGAGRVAERAREELAAIGSRPRSAFRTGVESLTASELRTAKLAADGLTNTEIAQRLFVTTKTVEKHLGNAYTKLEISTRTDLPTALSAETAA
jgi:DNA-binding CsgD family transcriptional regulator